MRNKPPFTVVIPGWFEEPKPTPLSSYLGSCDQAKEDLGFTADCCGSCHEDCDEYGYSLLEISTDEGYYQVCCNTCSAYEEGSN